MIANILDIFNIETAKQNQKFPFHFLSAPPTPPFRPPRLEPERKGKLPKNLSKMSAQIL